jgi:hypothetical protein
MKKFLSTTWGKTVAVLMVLALGIGSDSAVWAIGVHLTYDGFTDSARS